MEGFDVGAIMRLIGEGGIYGLGWLLFLYMMVREIRERKRYSDLVIHIISYFTKVNMVERQADDAPIIPAELFGITTRRSKRPSRQRIGHDDDA
jgi:hypothetical protein